MKKVFLGGTCNNSLWRDKLIPKLKIDYFNPVVQDWTQEDYKQELKQRQTCDYCLYVITPRMTGVYSIAEVIDDSNKRPQKTIFSIKNDFDDNGDKVQFTKPQLKSLIKVGAMVKTNGGHFIINSEQLIRFLNAGGK